MAVLGSFVANTVLTAAELNAIFNAYGTYTPTLSNITEGDGTKTGYYTEENKHVHFYARFVFGATSAVVTAATIGVTLPATASRTGQHLWVGRFVNAGVNAYPAVCEMATTSRVDLYVIDTSGSYAVNANPSTTVPFTWGTADFFELAGVFEKA